MNLKTLLLSSALCFATSLGFAQASSASAAKADYPLQTCVVSGEELGSMGDAFEYIHKEEGKADRVVLMCCEGCVKKFKKDPAKYLARLDAAQADAAKKSPDQK